jgi:CO/xanthine dehydrogenase Mo-binding subunit
LHKESVIMTETTTGRRRVAQDRMARGVGQFLAEVKLPGMGYAAFVRSPYAHAKITRILTHDALHIPGAIAVLTPADLLPPVNAVRPGEPGVSTYSRSYNRSPLPRETVTCSGEAVVAVVAQDRYSAEDMVEAVQVVYAPLPAVLDVDASLANVDVKVSAQSSGQGHERVFAKLAAAELGISEAVVRVVEGDTDTTPFGSGSTVSRSAVSTGGALHLALQDLQAKLLQVARLFLDTNAELDLAAGQVFVKHHPARSVPLSKVIAAAYNRSLEVVLPETIDPGLECTRTYDPPHQVFGNGAHVAVVRVDLETGSLKVEQYYIVEDCGTILDHDVVAGQVHGAVAQGIGNAIFEALAYDADGQLLTASLMDYLVPTASDIPTLHAEHMETPSPFTFNGGQRRRRSRHGGGICRHTQGHSGCTTALGHCSDGIAPQPPAALGAGSGGSTAAFHGSTGGSGR